MNQLVFKHSSRRRPLNDSNTALSVGLPGQSKAATASSEDHLRWHHQRKTNGPLVHPESQKWWKVIPIALTGKFFGTGAPLEEAGVARRVAPDAFWRPHEALMNHEPKRSLREGAVTSLYRWERSAGQHTLCRGFNYIQK